MFCLGARIASCVEEKVSLDGGSSPRIVGRAEASRVYSGEEGICLRV
jgi:hypothetical protein